MLDSSDEGTHWAAFLGSEGEGEMGVELYSFGVDCDIRTACDMHSPICIACMEWRVEGTHVDPHAC